MVSVLNRNISAADYGISLATNYIFRIQHSDSYYYYSYSHQYVIYKLCIFCSMHYNVITKMFVDLVASDYPQNISRFLLSYNLLSISYNIRFFFSFFVHNNSLLCSITTLFQAANWYEREILDLFGIVFRGHSDLRRILTDYGFRGHPLKKDYPLSGFTEVCYDEHYKCISYIPVYLIQDMRGWSFGMPWSFHDQQNV
jgi:NADH-quinone oxidoreductase subunit C